MGKITDANMIARTGKRETIRVVFRKTVLKAKYETEVYEAETAVDVENITGIERMIISHVVLGQLEYSLLLKLVLSGKVSKEEFDTATKQTEYGIKLLVDKAKSLGVEVDLEKYIGEPVIVS